MDKQSIYTVLKDVVSGLQEMNPEIKPLPAELTETAPVFTFGIDEVLFSELVDELDRRFGNRNLQLRHFLNSNDFQTLTLGALVSQMQRDLAIKIKEPLIVYVDDEEENLFIFKRKFGKRVDLETFTDPIKALEFIKINPRAALVITDEVMPGLSGNNLCDEVRKFKPFMKFILITGNPENDSNLLHKSLGGNRFFEFISKPLDLEKKSEDYFRIIQNAMA